MRNSRQLTNSRQLPTAPLPVLTKLPWIGGVNTSQDSSLIGPDELTVGDNFVYGPNLSKLMRDGLNLGWDTFTAVANGTSSIVGSHEFWSGTTSRTQQFLSANAAKQVRKYTTGGVPTLMTDGGKAWSGTVDIVDFITYNNKAIIAPAGSGNLMKLWDGSASSYGDLKNTYGHVPVATGSSSSGTTRTIVLSTGFRGVNSDVIVVSGATGGNSASYNGTWTVTSVATTTITNDTITFTGVGALAEGGTTYTGLTVDGVAPYGSILREHLGRVWTNDKTNPDRIHYCGSFNHLQWLGIGDSAALDIGLGDGDPVGVTAIFPSFKGDLYVAKQTKIYKISGNSPDTFSVELVSDGIGCVSHKSAISIDEFDIQFVSLKGVHSLDTLLNGNYLALYRPGENGSSTAKYLSDKIQRTFNTNFTKSRLKYVSAAYLPNINCSMFSFTDASLLNTSNTASTQNNVIWLYNIDLKAWHRWPDISCETITKANDSDGTRVYFGSYRGKITKGFTGNAYDLSEAAAHVVITLRITTGQIPLSGSIYNQVGVKKLALYYTPYGSNIITYNLTIDNQSLDSINSNAFTATVDGDLLDSTFILDESLLSETTIMKTFICSIEGFGRTVKLDILQTGTANKVEIQGFSIEFEPTGPAMETF